MTPNRIWRQVVIAVLTVTLFFGSAAPSTLAVQVRDAPPPRDDCPPYQPSDPILNGDLPLPDPDYNEEEYLPDDGKKETYLDSCADFNIMVGPQPPGNAPNVLLVLLDDVGFGAAETFGGAIHTPTLEKLAGNGLKYNRFHTTAICAPTRAALLTGHNHQSAATGTIQEHSTGFPGYSGLIPQSTATIGQILQAHGYTTAWFGKNHNVPDNQTSALGPFNRWPNDLGFDYFYGFIGAEADQFYPALYENRTPIDPPETPEEGYNLNHDLADKAINWVKYNHSLSPDTPFFLYFAPGATHAPHQPPSLEALESDSRYEYYVDPDQAAAGVSPTVSSYIGEFNHGWDEERVRIFDRQKELGVIPPNTTLTPRPDNNIGGNLTAPDGDEYIPAWDAYSSEEQEVLALEMENYARYLEYTDREVGRVVDAIDELGETGNTLVIYIVGDNGASAEGGFPGTCNEVSNLNGLPLTMEDNQACKGDWGNKNTSPHYAVGWAWAMNSPFRWAKQVASYFGGTRNPMVISWPAQIQDDTQGGLRDQFHHVIDIVPTILEVTGIGAPSKFNGIDQKPIEGTSLAYTFGFNDSGSDGKEQPDQHQEQYFEIVGHRAFFKDGWMASAFHRVPWGGEPTEPFNDDKWELFNLDADFSQSQDLSAQQPIKLAELQDGFDQAARDFDVYPLDDRLSLRFDASLRPSVLGDRTKFEFYEGATRLPEPSAPNTKRKSHTITAELYLREGEEPEGVILANGGTTGGYTLYVNKQHHLVYEYNYLDTKRTKIRSRMALPDEGLVKVRFEFTCGDSEPANCDAAKGGTGRLYFKTKGSPYKKVAEKEIPKTVPVRFGVDTQDVGMDLVSSTSKDYTPPYKFTGGTIEKVTINLDPKFLAPKPF